MKSRRDFKDLWLISGPALVFFCLWVCLLILRGFKKAHLSNNWLLAVIVVATVINGLARLRGSNRKR